MFTELFSMNGIVLNAHDQVSTIKK